MTTSAAFGPLDDFPRQLLVSVDLRGGRVQVAGDLDRACAHHLTDGLGALALTAHRTWAVDVGRVAFCDACGLRTLAEAEVLARAGGARVWLVRPRPLLVRMLGVVGLDGLLDPPVDRPARLASPARPTVWRCTPPP